MGLEVVMVTCEGGGIESARRRGIPPTFLAVHGDERQLRRIGDIFEQCGSLREISVSTEFYKEGIDYQI